MRRGDCLRKEYNVTKIIIPTLYSKILWLYLSFKKGERQEQAPAVRIKKQTAKPLSYSDALKTERISSSLSGAHAESSPSFSAT